MAAGLSDRSAKKGKGSPTRPENRAAQHGGSSTEASAILGKRLTLNRLTAEHLGSFQQDPSKRTAMTPFTAEDLLQHKKITDLHGLPGNPSAFGTVRTAHQDGNEYTTEIWRFHASGKQAEPITSGDGTDNAPRLSPDGRTLAFLSSRAGGSPQLYLLPLGGGEARQLGSFPKGVTNFRWAPTSSELFLGIPVGVNPDLRGKRGSTVESNDQNGGTPEVCWKLPYKMDGMGYLLAREIHIYSIAVETGKATRITDGAFDVLGFDPSQDGKQLAYTRTRDGRYAHLTDLWLCDAGGTNHRRITRDLAMVMQPSWSPDGKWVAFCGAASEGDSQTRLWLLDAEAGTVQALGGDALEVAHPEALMWESSSARLFLSRAWRGRHQIVAVTVPEGRVDVLASGDRQFGVIAPLADGFAYTVQTPAGAEELFYRKAGDVDKTNEADESDEAKISALNAWWTSRTPIEVTTRFFDVPDGMGGQEKIEGWLLRARGTPDGKPTPLLNDIHGGPAAYALLDFDTNVYWQVLCSQGWSILLLNAVGSASFGTDFCARLSGNWGEIDLPQHLAAIRQLQAEGVCDERVCVAGKSYGGYLSCWAIGHTDVFKAAVVMAPVGNIETHYGTSDGGYYADPLYIGTAPDFVRSRARELSPLQYVEKATTPTLFLQGKDDERCPKCQSEELFVSLYRAGDTHTELVLYPDEGHLFLAEGKPACRLDAARRIIDWCSSHIN